MIFVLKFLNAKVDCSVSFPCFLLWVSQCHGSAPSLCLHAQPVTHLDKLIFHPAWFCLHLHQPHLLQSAESSPVMLAPAHHYYQLSILIKLFSALMQYIPSTYLQTYFLVLTLLDFQVLFSRLYIKYSLAAGIIHPSSSPAGPGFSLLNRCT